MEENRSTLLYGVVCRGLKAAKISPAEVGDQFIYNEMRQAQLDIISRTYSKRIVIVELVEGVPEYQLSLKLEDIDSFTHSGKSFFITGIDPVYSTAYYVGTIDDNGLMTVFPAPDKDAGRLEILSNEDYQNLIISDTIEPEIPVYWDKAIEYYTLAQLIPEMRDKFMSYYEHEIEVKKGTSRRNRPPLERASVL